MILEQFFLGCLAQASYLVADADGGVAAVVDPRRDVDSYVERAEQLGVQITHVLLTHFHADFVAGHLELRKRTGAQLCLGARATAEFDFTPLADGSAVQLGDVRLEAAETPGHTPESISILVYDLARDERRPHAVLTGDTLFIGDVGRPDLAAAPGRSAAILAGSLYDSLHGKLLPLPDATLVYPGHGAGSLCGRQLSAETVSTIGVQRRENYALRPMSRDDFVDLVTADQPDIPAYFEHAASVNTREHRLLDDVLEDELRPLDVDAVLAAEHAQLLDTRDAASFAVAHLGGSINIGLDGNFASWAGSILDRQRPVVLVTEPGRERESAVRLARVGCEAVAGYLAGGMHALAGRPHLVDRYERVTAAILREQLLGVDPPTLLDVRTSKEWLQNRIDGSLNVPLGGLRRRLDDIPRGHRVVVVCGSGYRSAVAASVLRLQGFDDVTDLVGGIAAWDGLPAAAPGTTVRDRPALPGKDASLTVFTYDPPNAETPLELLGRTSVTPTELFFVRSHGTIPDVDRSTYRLAIVGLVRDRLLLSLDELRRFARVEVAAAIQCAGNRRDELAAVAPIPDELPWGAGAVGNGIWGGVRLRDVLEAASPTIAAGHVAFTGLDEVTRGDVSIKFGGSIPLAAALDSDVLLADELNGRPLPPVHGAPLRVVVPGTIGARSVKWLSTVRVQAAPSSNHFQADTYHLDGPSGGGDAGPGIALDELPVNAVTCDVRDGVARGYALTGRRRRIERVEVSCDSGKSWVAARLLDDGPAGSWRLWEAPVSGLAGGELVVRAWDSSANTQPESPATRWNPKGYLNNAWHRVSLD
jgi:DMSO/TMAO reductase YedYZ molybdopterin-dependent catalytic subunit/glyoxylase-like metal-dependent hydrolase (beta-lactamase superfamily II)